MHPCLEAPAIAQSEEPSRLVGEHANGLLQRQCAEPSHAFRQQIRRVARAAHAVEVHAGVAPAEQRAVIASERRGPPRSQPCRGRSGPEVRAQVVGNDDVEQHLVGDRGVARSRSRPRAGRRTRRWPARASGRCGSCRREQGTGSVLATVAARSTSHRRTARSDRFAIRSGTGSSSTVAPVRQQVQRAVRAGSSARRLPPPGIISATTSPPRSRARSDAESWCSARSGRDGLTVRTFQLSGRRPTIDRSAISSSSSLGQLVEAPTVMNSSVVPGCGADDRRKREQLGWNMRPRWRRGGVPSVCVCSVTTRSRGHPLATTPPATSASPRPARVTPRCPPPALPSRSAEGRNARRGNLR